jgi:hypothetical protein
VRGAEPHGPSLQAGGALPPWQEGHVPADRTSITPRDVTLPRGQGQHRFAAGVATGPARMRCPPQARPPPSEQPSRRFGSGSGSGF